VFKSFLSSDLVTSKTILSEQIPISGSLCSASYGTYPNETNVKNYTHSFFQKIFDYPYLSSSANSLFDISVGYSNTSALSNSSNVQNDKKIALYSQMAQQLYGFDQNGNVNLFDQDGNIILNGTKIQECYFINFARLLTKDEIKKGSFSIELGNQAYATANNTRIVISDAGAENDFKVNSPVGEYSILSASSGQTAGSTNGLAGLLFYQAGVAVLTASIFASQPTGMIASDVVMSAPDVSGGGTAIAMLTGSSITGSADALRHRIYNISFNNTTELNSTIYFCRVDPGDFNYSSNPSYVSGSKIRVKQNSTDQPQTYITTVGLYSSNNELLGVAKLSEPLKKDPSTSLTLRVRTDW
jgi:hypothetical protein